MWFNIHNILEIILFQQQRLKYCENQIVCKGEKYLLSEIKQRIEKILLKFTLEKISYNIWNILSNRKQYLTNAYVPKDSDITCANRLNS